MRNRTICCKKAAPMVTCVRKLLYPQGLKGRVSHFEKWSPYLNHVEEKSSPNNSLESVGTQQIICYVGQWTTKPTCCVMSAHTLIHTCQNQWVFLRIYVCNLIQHLLEAATVIWNRHVCRCTFPTYKLEKDATVVWNIRIETNSWHVVLRCPNKGLMVRIEPPLAEAQSQWRLALAQTVSKPKPILTIKEQSKNKTIYIFYSNRFSTCNSTSTTRSGFCRHASARRQSRPRGRSWPVGEDFGLHMVVV